ncbi:putative major facilitator superfamily sugar transporter [Trypanosoma vivax]|nr:putative major facilitator superfamily sugar transporter [Trypanosoma vivax]
MREAVALTNEQSSPPLASHEPDGENAAPMPRRSWWDRHVTPKVVLIIFTALNFITYYDRGAIAGCLVVIKEDPSIAGQDAILSDTLSGFLFSGFMVGFMVASPLCAALGGVVSSKWVIVGGMVVWAVSCIVSGVAHSYAVLLASRILAGVGEAAFVGFSVAIIDAIAPRESRTSWIGTFYSMIPVGTSLGMALGGVISGLDPIFGVDAWRVTFISEVFVSIPIVLPIAFFPSRYNMRTESDREYLPLHKATFALMKNVKYLLVVFGYAMYCFVIGAISVWSIPMLVEGPMQLTNLSAALIMGGVSAVTGVFGSLAGGIAVDKLGGSCGVKGTMKCQLFSTLMLAISVPLGLTALFMKDLWLFIPLLVLSVFALFAVTAPVNASILTMVSWDMRAYAVSYSVFLIHLLGDFPSPAFAGFLSDNLFSRGCMDHKDHDTCARDVVSYCHWANGTSTKTTGYCVSKYQLRNALLVIYSFLSLAVPSWMAVYYLCKRQI